MTAACKRILSAALALILLLSLPLGALAQELDLPAPDSDPDQGSLLEITEPLTYTPDSRAGSVEKIQKGGRYTLIILPASAASGVTTAAQLASALRTDNAATKPLFIGSAVAADNGQVTFTGIHPRTAEAAVYFVTGPGLDTPLRESTNLTISLSGKVVSSDKKTGIPGATVSLQDSQTEYSYANAVITDSAGSYAFPSLAPGVYDLIVSKPGYLPATIQKDVVVTESIFPAPFDYSSYLGDLNADGKRDLADLTDFLTYYKTTPLPASLTLDLNGDATIDQTDLARFLTAAVLGGSLRPGSGTPSATALTAQDNGPESQTDRTLAFSLDNGGVSGLTFTAASISLTFRSDYVQPINLSGGVIYPTSSSTTATCLVPKSGVTLSNIRWSLNGDLTTLSFSVTSDTPATLQDLVAFRYRPAPGKTAADFFDGLFTISHAAAQVGSSGLLDGCDLTYPGSQAQTYTGLTISADPQTLTIPAAGRTAVSTLSVTGETNGVRQPVKGVAWSMEGATTGVSISGDLLSVTSDAKPGTVTLTAWKNGVESSSYDVTLKNAPSVATSLVIYGANGSPSQPITQFTHLVDGERPHAQILLSAAVLDQYGASMSGQTISWSLSGAPADITVSQDGVVSVADSLPTGTYDFSLHATSGSLHATCAITVQRVWPLKSLTISGPSTAQIPAIGAGTLTLRYAISAIDGSGAPLSTGDLSLRFTVDGGDPLGVTSDCNLNGDCTVTIDPSALPGTLTLRVTNGDSAGAVSATFSLTLQKSPGQPAVSDPVRAAISYQDSPVDSLQLSYPHGGDGSGTRVLYPTLLNQDGDPVNTTSAKWTWPDLLSRLPAGATYDEGVDGRIELHLDTVPIGAYFFTLSAKDTVTGLSCILPISLTVFPYITSIDLQAPAGDLTIPASGTLQYPIRATYWDGVDQKSDPVAVTPPGPVTWHVRSGTLDDRPTVSTAPDGVTIENGVLTISSAAKPGTITVTVQCEAPKDYDSSLLLSSHSLQLELTASSSEEKPVLALRRGGQLLYGGADTAYGKEGAAITLTYEPVLVDQVTGEATALTDGVTWVGVQGSFTVDKNTEPGTYSTSITAIYNGQSISLNAQITVYPDITAIYADFGADDADQANASYSFTVPSTASKTYRGPVMATIRRGGTTQNVPLSSLTLPDYQLDFYTYLTGVYLAYDYATGQLSLTIDPAAGSNSMEKPSNPYSDIRYIGVEFSYYPGETYAVPDPDSTDPPTPNFILTPEPLKVTATILRQGVGSGSKFVFESAPATVSIKASPGILSHCYALELLDQYGNPMKDQYVAWTLSGNTANGAISLIDPGEAISKNYPRYQSIRRLRIAPDAPAGTYTLTLTAGSGSTEDAAKNDPAFTGSIAVTLEVSATQELQNVILTGATSSVIPMWYNSYNRPPVLNDKVQTVTYVAAAQGPDGSEVDASLCDFAWSVTDSSGKVPDGVTIASDAKTPSAATVTITRYAQPTDQDPLQVTATVTPKGGGTPKESDPLQLTLYRASLIPVLLTIQGGPTSYTLEKEDAPVTNTYTFTMVDQYNDPAPGRDCTQVKWSMSGGGNIVSMKETTDPSTGYPAARLTVTPRDADVRGTVTLRASITFTNAQSATGKTTVYQDLSIPYVIGNPPAGGGGGLLPPEELLEEPDPTTQRVAPKVSQSGTTGSVSLSEEEANALIASTVSGALTIAPSGGNGLTSINVTLPSDVTKSMAGKNQSLRLDTALGTLTVPVAALSSLNAAGGKTVSITILNQDNTLSVSFRAGSRAVTLGAPVTLQAPVKGNVVLTEENGVQTLQKKLAILNGQLTALLTGDTRFQTDTRGKTFSDTQRHWAKDAVVFVTARDLFQGTSATTFSPSGDMTRGMVVTVLHRLEDQPATSAANVFRDVPDNTWYADGVLWANERGIVQGNGDGFLPDDPVTREQLVTILYRYMNHLGLTSSRRSSLTPFSDSAQVSSWARDAMEWAVAAGLITGKTGGLLDPGGKASRAEVATIIERLVRTMTPSI